MEDQKFLRHLVDCVWNHVTESNEVPSTITADKLISHARDSYEQQQIEFLKEQEIIAQTKEPELAKYTKNQLFVEYYTHTGCDMYKILNEHTGYREDKWVLCPVSEGRAYAIDLAIKEFKNRLK